MGRADDAVDAVTNTITQTAEGIKRFFRGEVKLEVSSPFRVRDLTPEEQEARIKDKVGVEELSEEELKKMQALIHRELSSRHK